MIKLSILGPSLMDIEAEPSHEESIRISEKLYRALSLGSARPIFNLHDNEEYYSLLAETRSELLVALVSKPKSSNPRAFYINVNREKVNKLDSSKVVHVELWKFQYPTGPPVVDT